MADKNGLEVDTSYHGLKGTCTVFCRFSVFLGNQKTVLAPNKFIWAIAGHNDRFSFV